MMLLSFREVAKIKRSLNSQVRHASSESSSLVARFSILNTHLSLQAKSDIQNVAFTQRAGAYLGLAVMGRDLCL